MISILDLKMWMLSECRTASGRDFHARGPAVRKLWEENRLQCVGVVFLKVLGDNINP